MVTIAHLVRKIMKDKPFIQECINDGIINYGALAEHLRQEIEEELGKPVKQLAISMALRRYSEGQKLKPLFNLKIDKDTDLVSISNQVEIIVKKSSKALNNINKFAENLKVDEGDIISVIQGSREISVVTNSRHLEKILKVFSKDEIVTTRNNLGIILMYIPKKYITTPGFFYLLSKNLAFNNVNIIGLSNIETEVFFLFENKDLPRAYKILTGLIPEPTTQELE